MGQTQDLTGRRYGQLTAEIRDGHHWICSCDCGGTSRVLTALLNNGSTRACSSGVHRRKAVSLEGRRFGALVALAPVGGSHWLTRCDCGAEVTKLTARLVSGASKHCGSYLHRRKDAITYGAAHDRARTLWGPARQHLCIGCGEPAQEWAYDHHDPSPSTAFHNGSPVTFSLHPEFYMPMCVACHRSLDADHRKVTSEYAQSE